MNKKAVYTLLCLLFFKILTVGIANAFPNSTPIADDFLPNEKGNFKTSLTFKSSLNDLLADSDNHKSNLFVPTYSTHYIAPAPWQYWNKANQIVITTESTSTISGSIYKSNGAKLYDFTTVANTPFVRVVTNDAPSTTPTHQLNTVLAGAGLIVIANGTIAVNLRNIASDNLGGDGNDAQIKGNASLFSFGDAAIGTAFRVGYYRDGTLSGSELPIYSIMAIENNTVVKIAGVATATLNKGESYLFQSPIGTLVESSGPAVMNTGARLDAPEGCGDGAYNPIPPIVSLGSEYVIVKGEGNLTAEQTTVIASEPNTKFYVEFYDENGVFKRREDFTISAAGGFKTFKHGYINGTNWSTTNNGKFSSSRIVAEKDVLVFSGTGGISVGGGCEVDVAALVPIEKCGGSKNVETYKFTSYTESALSYFGYILTNSPTDVINLKTTTGNKNIESIPSVGNRKPLGTSGLYLIKFTDADIGKPNVITLSSNTRLTVSMVQQGDGFSMSNFISRFAEKAGQPTVDKTDCSAAILTAQPSDARGYKWYFNGVEINGATANTYVAKASGNYTLTVELECGMSAQSLPLIISLCDIDRSIKKTVDKALPNLGEEVSFKLVAENLGSGNAIGVSVLDKLPAGYTYVSHTTATGSYDSATGIWSIGGMNSGASAELIINAKVAQDGTNINKAKITGTQTDINPNNDESEISTRTELGTVTLVPQGSPDRSVCLNTAIEEIVYKIGGGASSAVVTNLPAGFNYTQEGDLIKITGSSNVPTLPEGTTYTITTVGGIPASKSGIIVVKPNVSAPVFMSELATERCAGSGEITYSATATNSESIVYQLAPTNAGTINAATGLVSWAAEFVGEATVRATAKGCDQKFTEFKINVLPRPLAPTAPDPVYCQNQTGVLALTATTERDATLVWYDSNKQVLSEAPIPSTATAGTQIFYVAQKFDIGCEGEKTEIKVTINPTPSKPTAPNPVYCQNQTGVPELTATASTDATLVWYNESGQVLPSTPTPSTATVGTQKYYVAQKFPTGCEGPKAEIVVTINPLPAAPAVSATLSYCQNQTGVLALSANPDANATLVWYNESGQVLPSAPTPSTAVAGTFKHYVAQKFSTGCEGPKAEIVVTINPLPAAPTVSNLTYCQNQTGVPALTANPNSNATLVWYNESGQVLPSTPTPSTATVGTQKYYVAQKFPTGCEGPKAEIVVTVNPLPGAPTVSATLAYCQNQTGVPALTATSSNGATLVWYNESGQVLPSTPTPSTATVGTQKYYVAQKFPTGCEGPKAEIVVTVNPLPRASTVSATLAYCQNQTGVPELTANPDANATLVWYNEAGQVLPSAPTPSTATVGTQKYYVAQKFSTGCEGSKAEIVVTINPIPAAPTVSATLAYCQNQTGVPELIANPDANATLVWYNETGQVLPSAPTPSTATVGTQKYYVAQKFSIGCEGPKAEIVVTINPIPAAPTVSATLAYCQNQTGVPALTANPDANATLVWYNETGQVLPSAPTPSTATVGIQKYFVAQKFATGCEGPKAEIVVTVNPLPGAPTVSATLSYCQNQSGVPELSANPDANATLVWYNEAGQVLPSAPTPSTATVGTQKYYVAQKLINGCESEKAEIVVTINPLPAAPTVSNLTYCQNQTGIPALTASASSGATLVWYNESGQVLSAAPTPSTATVGTLKYYVAQKFSTGCEGPKAEIVVTINPLPAAPTVSATLAYCQNQTGVPALTATSSNGATLVRYNEAGQVLPSAPTPSTATVGTQKYYVAQKLINGCESEKAEITVTINPTPSKPTATNPVYCQNQTGIPELTASTSTDATLVWYNEAGQVLPSAPTPSTATVGTKKYYVAQKLINGCESEKAEITVTINPTLSKPTAPNPVYCQNQTGVPELTASTSTDATLVWYNEAGQVLPSAPTPSTAIVGTKKYYVAQKLINSCESEKAEIVVTINSLPAVPAVSATLSYCQNQTGVPELIANPAANATLVWYNESGQVLTSAPTPSTATVGTKKYYVAQKLINGCESEKAEITVTINPLPAAPAVSAALSYCQNQTGVPELSANPDANATLVWYNETGQVLPSAPTPSTATVGIQKYFVAQKFATGCEGPKAEIVITINPLPAAPTVSTTLAYCLNQTGVPELTANPDANAALVWYNEAGQVLPSAPTPSTATVGTQKYFVAQKLINGCESEKAEITVTINPTPSKPTAPNQVYCQNQTGVPELTASALTGATLVWYNESGQVLPSTPTPSTATVGTKKYYVAQKFSTGCEGPKAEIVVTINPIPAAPAVSATLSYCQNQIGVPELTATPSTDATLAWYNESGQVLTSAPIPSTATVGTQKYFVAQKFSTGCEGPKAEIVVTINLLPALPTVSATLSYCQNQTGVPALTANPDANATLVWYNETGQVLPSAPTPSTATVGTQKYYVAQKFPTGCESPKAEILVTINPLPAAPTVSGTLSYCQNQKAVPALTATASSGATLVWYNEAGQILPSAPTPSIATVGIQKYFVAQKFSTGCEGPKSEIVVTIIPLGTKPLITSSGNLQFCLGGSVILTSSTAHQYQWYKDNQPINGATGKSITITLSGEYRIETKNINGCSSLISDPVIIINEGTPTKPSITATTAIELCKGEKATLKSSASTGNQWYRNGSIIPGAIDQIFQTSLDGSYTVKTKTPAGCESLMSEPISIIFKDLLPPPSISPVGEQVICRGGRVTLSSSSSTGNQWFKDGVLIPGAVNQTYVATSGGIYSAKAINTTGCGGTISNIVQVNEVDFKISLSANDEFSQPDGSIVLKTSSNLKYKVVSWSPQNLFQKQDATTQSLNLKSNVNVVVNVMSENGCITSASLALNYTKKRDLFIPNTFTPNADGKNDFVKVYGNEIDAVEFMVYTQWGELIYRSKEKDASWDGNYRGLPQPVGVYLYKCVVRFNDGEELTKHGAINLLR
ncbi:Ig-like domain-containing protein [Pedobacter jejuensis]|uniref:DUF11 domain-containing protein n=1 Tax=Pedobacter jejuensis TaxID=1268550 RepID=A0A3N0C0R9_9SPHI|nr:gliding motility-associated C-terminal domain-containing protein [Pedobacter jejuensis]RNL55787.1 DUF11 domain-containing protein [Pedobacter jejuensis]